MQLNVQAGRIRRIYGRGRVLALAPVAWLVLCAAGQPATPPSPIPPTRDEIEARVAPPPREARSRLDVEGGLARAPCALDRPEYAAIRVTPRSARFDGLQGLAAADLRAAYAPFLGTDQPLSVICEIRDRAAALLREAGYIAAVEVPEQRIENGELRFRVITAKLVGLRVRGDAGPNERLIASYLERLTRRDVFNTHEAERYLLLARDLPGYNVRLALRPAGTAPGEVVGEVTIVRMAGQLDFNVQNYGSNALGPLGLLLRGQLYGLTGLGDRTTLALYTTADLEEQQTAQVAHDFRIGGEGLQLGGQLTYSWGNPDFGDPAFDIRSRTLFATVEAHYPLVRTQRFSLRAGGGLDIADQIVEFNTLALSEDHLRVLFARAGFEAAAPAAVAADPVWEMEGSAELRQGLDIFGATTRCDATFTNCTAPGIVPPSRLEGDPTATVLRAAFSGEFRPDPTFAVFIGIASQYSGSPLLSFEEFSAGNYTIGRGYDPATIVGDRGAGIQAELRFGRLAPRSADDLALQPYVFFDAAWVDNEDRIFVGGGREDLQSLGGGVRAVWADRAQFDLTLAVPLAPAGFLAETPDPRLLFSVTTRLLPWSMR